MLYLPWSIASAGSACYNCSTADAGDMVGVEVETGELQRSHCVDTESQGDDRLERLHVAEIKVAGERDGDIHKLSWSMLSIYESR